SHTIKGSATHSQHDLGALALHGSNGVAGVNRTLEGGGIDHTADFRNLFHVQQGSNTRRKILAHGSSRRQDGVVILADFGNQITQVLGQLMCIGSVVGQQYLADAGYLGGLISHGSATCACHQYRNVTTNLLRRSYHSKGNRVKGGVVVFCNYEDAHQITFASFFSFATSSSTEATLMPALR